MPNTKKEKSSGENTDESDCVGPFISEVHSESLVKEEREEIEMRMEEESLNEGNIALCKYLYHNISLSIL